MKVENILIVDDDNEDSEFFTLVVNQIDPAIKVEIATNRDELFEHLRNKIPDLLFIDSFIQQHSGVSSISEIKNDRNWHNLPVIMYTGASDKRNITSAFNAGASAYIIKPQTTSEIKKALQFVFNKDWKQPGLPKHFYMDNSFVIYPENEKPLS